MKTATNQQISPPDGADRGRDDKVLFSDRHGTGKLHFIENHAIKNHAIENCHRGGYRVDVL
ncbi:hypothetical protein ACS25B_12040 [Dickeya dadantii subsp. dieffenbachiae]|uniref:hypothetical protein n=1 Tax=Dickeya dadantii TaxID=204038 RepID=UPI001268C482|nr:hypothetical protein [Dickeya dadantii]